MNLLDLAIKVSCDDQASDEIDGISTGAIAKANALGNMLSSGIMAGASVVADAVRNIASSAFNAYGSYQQLTGGVETLFKDSADAVMEYAENAYRTAGLSANDYMETATGFAASLISSLGGDTALAAFYADTAITDMSDNANKMGTSIESIQNAYAGFSKQNFTMLDNLKLGYGGTKEEMERLLVDAEAIAASQGYVRDYSIDSYADIVEAIHVVQGAMGITGTTAMEAASTIQGSLGMLSASWENLIAGLGDPNADVQQLAADVVDSVEIVLENAVPTVVQIVRSIAEAVPELMSDVAGKVTASLESAFGTSDIGAILLEVGTDAIQSLRDGAEEAMPSVIEFARGIPGTVSEAIGDLGTLLVDVGTSLVNGLLDGVEALMPSAVEFFNGMPEKISAAMGDLGTLLADGGSSLIGGLLDGAESLMPSAEEFADSIPGKILEAVGDLGSLLVYGGSSLIEGLLDGAGSLMPVVSEFIGGIPETISSAIGDLMGLLFDAGIDVAQGLVDGMDAFMPMAVEFVKGIPDMVSSAIGDLGELLASVGSDVIGGLVGGMEDSEGSLSEESASIPELIATGIGEIAGLLVAQGAGVIQGLIDGISGMFSDLDTTAADIPTTIVAAIGDIFTVLSAIGESAMTGFLNAVDSVFPGFSESISSGIDGIIQFFTDLPQNILDALGDMGNLLVDTGANLIQGFINGVTSLASGIGDSIMGAVNGAVDAVTGFLEVNSPSKLFMRIGASTMEGFSLGVEGEYRTSVIPTFDAVSGFVSSVPFEMPAPRLASAGGFGDVNIYIDGMRATGDESEFLALLSRLITKAA